MSEITKTETNITVKPQENIVNTQVEIFKKELLDLVKDATSPLIVDLEKVTMIDSSGLSVLISIQNSLQEKEQKLIVSNVSKDIAKLFKIMRLDKHFEVREVENQNRVDA